MKKKRAFFKWLSRPQGLQDENLQVSPMDGNWQEEYLVKKVQAKFPSLPVEQIRQAVKGCLVKFSSPQHGEKLMQCIAEQLQPGGG